MSQPPPYAGGAGGAGYGHGPDWYPPGAGGPVHGAATSGLPTAPSWAPAWHPTSPTTGLRGGSPSAPVQRSSTVYLTVRLAVLLAGSAASGVVVAGQILAGAAEVGHGIGEEVAASMDEAFLGGGPDPYAPVDQFPAAAPGALGTDPALDELARRCYTGDLQACDDLYLESPPLSDYEEYAFTCGGRVKYATVPFCTDLE